MYILCVKLCAVYSQTSLVVDTSGPDIMFTVWRVFCLSEVKCVLAPWEVHLVLQCVLCREVISMMTFILCSVIETLLHI